MCGAPGCRRPKLPGRKLCMACMKADMQEAAARQGGGRTAALARGSQFGMHKPVAYAVPDQHQKPEDSPWTIGFNSAKVRGWDSAVCAVLEGVLCTRRVVRVAC